jgi:hypothetical protein
MGSGPSRAVPRAVGVLVFVDLVAACAAPAPVAPSVSPVASRPDGIAAQAPLKGVKLKCATQFIVSGMTFLPWPEAPTIEGALRNFFKGWPNTPLTVPDDFALTYIDRHGAQLIDSTHQMSVGLTRHGDQYAVEGYAMCDASARYLREGVSADSLSCAPGASMMSAVTHLPYPSADTPQGAIDNFLRSRFPDLSLTSADFRPLPDDDGRGTPLFTDSTNEVIVSVWGHKRHAVTGFTACSPSATLDGAAAVAELESP